MGKQLEKYIDIIQAHQDVLEKEYNVKKIGIFGSYAKGKQRKKSDIDIIIEFSKTPGLFEFIRLELFLEKILKRKVDLVTKKALKSSMKKTVLRETVLLP